MRSLLAIVILAFLGWSGWWWFAATTQERLLTGWLAERRADGWIAEAGDITVRGYPNRLDAIVTGLELADPEAGWAWSAPEFQVLALSYRPNHVIAVWPGEHVIGTPYETLRVAGERLRGSVVFEPNTRLALDRATIEIEGLTLAGDGGWQAGLGRAVLAARRAGEGTPENAYEVAFEASDLVLPGEWRAGLDPGEMLPETVRSAELDAVVDFDRDWDRPAVEAGGAVVEGVRIRDLALAWGRLDLRARGSLDVDPDGLADGRLDLRARNWKEMIAVAEAAGALPAGIAGPLEAGLDLIATLSGDRNSLEVPLDFDNGRTRIGPVVVGPAPRLANR